MRDLVVSMWPKALVEEVVGKDPCLGEAIDCFANFNVDKSFVGMVAEFVLFDDVVWENGERYFHIFISCHRGGEIKVFDVQASVLGVGGADGAVPENLCSGEFGCARSEFSWVVDQVTSGCEADVVGVCFLRSVIDNDACIRDCAIPGDGMDLFMGEDKD